MAIVITKTLSYITSVFNKTGIEFYMPTGTVGVKVTINSIDFFAIKTQTDVTVSLETHQDVYEFFVTDIFKYIHGFPTLTISSLSREITITVAATGQTSENITTVLSFGYDNVMGLQYVISHRIEELYAYGQKVGDTIFHYDTIDFYYSGTPASVVCSIGAVDYTYSLVTGYNSISLNTVHLINGTFIVDGTLISIPLIYKPRINSDEYINKLFWLNDSGCFSRWEFRKLTKEAEINSSNPVPIDVLYQSTHEIVNINISKSKKMLITADTIAVNTAHFEQLTKIAESILIYFDGRICNVVNYTKTVAECRQNLHFTITLEYTDYVANY